jgi:hypothetical protein
MYAYKQAMPSERASATAQPSDELRIAVTFKRAGSEEGPTKFTAPLSLSSAAHFNPNPLDVDRALQYLSQLGFRPTRRGNLTVSIRAACAGQARLRT